MVNRKIETFLIVIGLVVYVFLGVYGATMLNASNDEEVAKELYENFIEEMQEEGMISSEEETPTFSEVNETLNIGGKRYLIVAIVAFIVGLASVFMIAKNKYPKIAGVLLILVGYFMGQMLSGIFLLGSLMYVPAGIMALFRKPRVRAI